MTTVIRRVPYGSEPGARAYHDAYNHASTKTDDYASCVKFTSWYVDNCAGRTTPADAWKHFERIAANK